jgi:hypothetical protein
MITPNRMRWVGHVLFMREKRHVYGVWVGKLKERGSLEDFDTEWRIISQWEGVVWIHLAQDICQV